MASSNNHQHIHGGQAFFHNTHCNSYERMAGRCTEHVANYILSTLNPPSSPNLSECPKSFNGQVPTLLPITNSSHVLDNACGPGLVTSLIQSRFHSSSHSNLRITATDLSPGMISLVEEKMKKHGCKNVQTQVADVRNLSVFADETFSHVIVNFGIQATGTTDTDGPEKAAREVYRVLQKGGVAAVSTWAERSWLPAFEIATSMLRPKELLKNHMVIPEGWERGSWLMKLLEDAGFQHNVHVVPVQTCTEAESLDELTDNTMIAAPMYLKDITDEEKAELRPLLKNELAKLSAFVEDERGARIGMLAWVGMAWK